MECLTWNDMAEVIARMTPEERSGPVQILPPDPDEVDVVSLHGAYAIERIGDVFSGEADDGTKGSVDDQHHPEHFILMTGRPDSGEADTPIELSVPPRP